MRKKTVRTGLKFMLAGVACVTIATFFPGEAASLLFLGIGGDVRITVADQGRGIPAEVKEKVFDRFESHSLGSNHRGVGLGLSIVRSIVELHGGHVELESSPGQGTRVSAIFPSEGVPLSDAAE